MLIAICVQVSNSTRQNPTVQSQINNLAECFPLANSQQLVSIFQHPILVAAAKERYPVVRQGSVWSCSCCGLFLTAAELGRGVAVGLHVCNKKLQVTKEELVKTGATVDSRGQVKCLFCHKFVGSSKPHLCGSPVANHYAYDLSHVLGVEGQLKRDGTQGELREALIGSCVLFVAINKVNHNGNTCYTRFHGYLAPSKLNKPDVNVGQGIFTLLDLPADGSGSNSSGDYLINPRLGGRTVLTYTGAVLTGDAALERLKQEDPTLCLHTTYYRGKVVQVVDPSFVGGLAVMANTAHGDRINMNAVDVVSDEGTGKATQLVIKGKKVKAFAELLWDYAATTDKEDDLGILCGCCGKPLYTLASVVPS